MWPCPNLSNLCELSLDVDLVRIIGQIPIKMSLKEIGQDSLNILNYPTNTKEGGGGSLKIQIQKPKNNHQNYQKWREGEQTKNKQTNKHVVPCCIWCGRVGAHYMSFFITKGINSCVENSFVLDTRHNPTSLKLYTVNIKLLPSNAWYSCGGLTLMCTIFISSCGHKRYSR